MDRRNFIKVSSILTAGSTVLTSCGKGLAPVTQLVPPDQVVIGEERRLKSACTGCGAGCGVEVRWIDSRAIKLEGLAGHPVNQGRLCARGQAELQVLYNPDRIQGPRVNGKDVTWDQAIEALRAKVRETPPEHVAVFTGPLPPVRRQVVDDFLKRLRAPARVEIDPLGESVVREANRRTTGFYALPAPDFENCDYVLSFGTPLLEAGPSPVRTMRGLAHMRQGRPGRRGKLVQIESRFSLTAAYADEWVFVNPGTEGALALAIGHLLGRPSEWTPEKAAAITAVPVSRIERLAKEFSTHKPAVALIGGLAAGHSNSLAAAEAVSALNQLNRSFGVPGGIWFAPTPDTRHPSPGAAPKLVFVIGCNPVYEAALPKDAYVASFSPFPDETAAMAQMVLPSHTALESWHEAAKPAMDPLYNTRDWADVLLQVSEQTDTLESLMQASYKSEEDHAKALETGWREPGPFSGVKKFEFGKERWEPPRFVGNGEFFLQPFQSVALGNGAAANVPWLQELPDPLSQTVWDSAVELNPRTAERIGLAEGDRVTVESAKGRLRARVALSPACPPHVVSIAAGQGHSALGRYASNRGGNVYGLIDPAHWAATKVNIRKAEG